MNTNTTQSTKKQSRLFVVLGFLEVILGILAICLPLIMGEAIVFALGVLLLVAMLFSLYQVFTIPHYRLWNLLGAIFYGLAGILFLANPTVTLVTLTIVLGWLFVIGGIFRLVMCFKAKSGWMAFNGVITLILGIIILVTLPEAALWVIGTLAGIELIFSGWTLATLGTAVNSTLPRD